jgi:molybdopterin/thiamine biosynthesis adenylyltransferase
MDSVDRRQQAQRVRVDTLSDLRKAPNAPGIQEHASFPSQHSRDGMYSRNWAFISTALQRKLAQATVLCAGTGLGSMIALLGVRTGFHRFILGDGDVVEAHNLNRQAFSRMQLGINKAEATAALIRSVAPQAQIDVLPRFLGVDDFHEVLPRADLVVNTIDLDNPAFLELNRLARKYNKTVLFPMNLGWAGTLLVFTPQSPSLDDFLGLTLEPAAGDASAAVADVGTRLIERILGSIPGGIPSYLLDLLPQFRARTPESWPFDPQLGVAAHVTSALTVHTCVALVAGQTVRAVPDIIWSDSAAAIEPAVSHADGEVKGKIGRHPVPGQNQQSTQPMPVAALPLAGLTSGVNGHAAVHAPHSRRDGEADTLIAARRMFDRARLWEEGQRGRRATLRAGTGLVVLTMRHDALTPDEVFAIATFRLRQYMRAGLYDEAAVTHMGVTEDPAMALLAAHDIHIAVGDAEGRFLCYMCAQSPLPIAEEHIPYPLLKDARRPVFPTESEYGLGLYGAHPAIQWLPMATTREISRLVRNLEISRGPTTEAASAEAVLAMEREICRSGSGIELTIGCMAPEARRLLYGLGVPIAYAPRARITGDNQGGGAPNGPLLWTASSHAPGRFWPYALATADLRLDAQYYSELDLALAQSDGDAALEALRRVRRSPHRLARYALPEDQVDSPAVLWTSDPFYSISDQGE